MKLSQITESKIYKVVGGAQLGTKYPEKFPHQIIDAPNQLLHGTSDLSIKRLKKTGFSTHNHLTANRKLAAYSAHRAVARFGGNPVVIVINTTGLDDLSLGGTLTDLHVLKPIPPSTINRIYKVRSVASKDKATEHAKYVGPQSYHQAEE